MLDFVGLDSLDDLFEMIPEALRLSGPLEIPEGLSEFDTMGHLESLGAANTPLISFAGGGCYDHDIPSVVRRLAGRTEFVTSYTPYQPEVAQGVLQALFEFQTFVSRLSGLPVANASLYDGATALVEAVHMAVAATGRQKVLMSDGVFYNWRQTVATASVGTGHELQSVPLSDGVTQLSEQSSVTDVGAVVIQQPNALGCLEDLTAARHLADSLGAQLIVAFDPVAVALLRTPGECGADIAIAEGQPFGTPLSLGGPYVGLFACSQANVRRLPGRLVGQTVDARGQTAYVTTLRTREQDIRREKASSNVCTNQTLIAVTAAIHLSWLGTSGLRELALRCARGTRYLRDQLSTIDNVESHNSAPVFREFTVRTAAPAAVVIDRMVAEGFLAGIAVEGDENALTLSVTEKRTRAQIDQFVTAFEKAAVK